MKTLLSLLAGCTLLAAVPFAACAQTMDHQLISPNDIKWGAAPPSLPAGAQAAVLYGDPGKEGLFAFRIKTPKDYTIAPHTHPKPEIVTVISGTVRSGMGTTADRAKAQVLPAGLAGTEVCVTELADVEFLSKGDERQRLTIRTG
jgi:quercetin dioxygenase-like cupin family protein